jgi:aspartokinase/homoserine dehydrogenase 1
LAIALIGATGRVGNDLLSLLARPDVDAPVQLVGVANSRAALWQPEGLAPGLAAERLRAQGGGSAESLIDQLIADGRPALLIDCTASAAIAAHGVRLLEAGVSLATPNKIAFSGAQRDYDRLRQAARITPAAWSATVGAGLPILSTIRRLRAAGDRLTAIEATLSGTLGSLLTRVHDGISLRQALTEAVHHGLAEPDPRIDLSGQDVRRKLTIMLREAGIEIEPDAIALDPLLHLSADRPWDEAVGTHERDWLGLIQDARRSQSRFVYRARWNPDEGAHVALALVPDAHPLAGARGTENRVVLHSEYQADTPIVIAGAGAGVRITAAAVLADVQALCEQLLPGAAVREVPARLRRIA